MSFYSALTTSLHKVKDDRGMGSVASDYPLQTLGDFGDLYWAIVSDLLKSSLQDYVTYSRKGDKCRFRFKHDTYLSDTDQDVSISADVKLSFVEGKGVAVTAIYGFSGTPGFTDTIRGYVSAGDLSNVIVSWFKTLSYDGKARSYYIDAWDDFSIALSNISEHPGFASAVSDAASPNSSLVGGTPITSSKDALDSLYNDIVTSALRHYKIEFRDIVRREDYFTLDYEIDINIQASAVKPLRQDVDQRLASVSLRAAADGSDRISVTVTFCLQAMSKEVSYMSEYAGSGYVNTAEFSLKSDKEISAFVSKFLSFLGRLQADGYVYDHYCKEFEKFASKVSRQQAVSDVAGDKDMRRENSNSADRGQSTGLSLQDELSLVKEHADEIMRAANIPYTKVTSVTPQGDVWAFRYINKAGVPMVVYFGRNGEGSSMGRSIAVKSRVIRDLLSGAHSVSDAASTTSSMGGVTPIESSFGGSTLYRVLLWPGRGYYRDVFYVRADSEESALEVLSTYLIKEGLTSYYYTEDEYADYLSRAGISEEEDTSYIYIDGTMEGALYPIYLLSENMRIEEV